MSKIPKIVLAVHFGLLAALISHHFITSTLRSVKPIAVRTIVQQAVPKQTKPSAPSPSKKSTKPAPTPALAKKAAPKQTSAPAPKKKAELIIPSRIETKPVPVVVEKTPTAPSYSEYLIGYLQNALDLPEFGEVRLKLEIDRFGHLLDCQVLESKSVKNGEFVKNKLKELEFACLNEFNIFESTHVFTITFRNVETR